MNTIKKRPNQMTVRFDDAIYEAILAKVNETGKSQAEVVADYVKLGMQNKDITSSLNSINKSLEVLQKADFNNNLNEINKSLAVVQNKIKFNTDITCYTFSNMVRKVPALLIKPKDDKDFQEFKNQRKYDKIND